MTIIEAIKEVLKDNPNGLTSFQIYEEIVKRKLYDFKAKSPENVVNGEIRRRCAGLDFPTAHPIKIFKIVKYDGKKIVFGLLDSSISALKGENNNKIAEDSLPEERLVSVFNEHIELIKQDILDRIMNQSPAFFEQLVVDLLVEMGYGYDKSAGVVTGCSHDGGIDGIINEDKLGLDLIYIQAKRYNSNNKVGRKELQAFVGAMQNIQKGVFITSSSFTNEAKDFIDKQQQKNIKLIDGKCLVDLMIKNEVGINKKHTFTIYSVDADYFG